MASAQQLSEIFARLQAVEGFANSNRLPNRRTIGKAIIDMQRYVKTLGDDPLVHAPLGASLEEWNANICQDAHWHLFD